MKLPQSGTSGSGDVFAASGEHIGVLDAPADLEIHDATADRIWAVVFDDFDVPYVVRLPVQHGA